MKICELLGLKPLEKFRIKNDDGSINQTIFCFNSDDKLCHYIETCHINYGSKITVVPIPCENKSKIVDLIHNPDLIDKIDDEKNKKEIILNLHDSIILSGIETQYNTTVVTVKKVKNWSGFIAKFKNSEKWESTYFDINFLKLDFLEDMIKNYNMIEFEIRKDEKWDYVAKQI